MFSSDKNRVNSTKISRNPDLVEYLPPQTEYQAFQRKIEQEFIEGSAIAPELFQTTIRFVADSGIAPGGEATYPIAAALNWDTVTRFGKQARDSLYAALFQQESGEVWQGKLSKELEAGKKPYLAPKGAGSRAFLPPIPLSIWRRICDRYQIQEEVIWLRALAKKLITLENINDLSTGQLSNLPPLSSNSVNPDESSPSTDTDLNNMHKPSSKGFSKNSQTSKSFFADEKAVKALKCLLPTLPAETIVPDFWGWVEDSRLDLIVTEGGKKALSLLSQGYVAIAVYGVNSGYQRLLYGTCQLIPDIARFANGRQLILAFDQDTKEKTRRRVALAIARFGGLLAQAKCPVRVATWEPSQGKGVDDLIVQGGAAAWNAAHDQALSLLHWQLLQRLEHRLTDSATVKVNTADLSKITINNVPEQGMIAISSAKGTGKTKLIQSLIKDSDKALAGGHRIALMRNLCCRLRLDYKGDLDKVQGKFITGAGYTLRVGFCVDSLLSIDPKQFEGCDLILDEVVQVIRHLLTSSTCAREGKRPALLARFREILQAARRVIVADADLNNATLKYLKELREEEGSVFLIRNDYQSEGYPVQFIEATDRTAIVGQLMAEIKKLPTGKAIFVATDGKGTSKAIDRLISKEYPDKRVLLINSETSGGDCEREFVNRPDDSLKDYDIIICSPSVATGVSIEAQGVIHSVYGIFTGAAGTDADLAQALGRVREPVQRVVWCVHRGNNFSPVSKATKTADLKDHLRQQSSVTVQLIRSSLREDTAESWGKYSWDNDPHIGLFCEIAATHNFAMFNLRDALLIRLQSEKNNVQVTSSETDPAIKALLSTARQELKEIDAEDLVATEDLTYTEVQLLEQKEGLSPEEAKAVSKFYFQDFYCLDTLTTDDVLWDNQGRRRREILSLEAQLNPGLAIVRTAKSVERQAAWQQGYCPWDISTIELRRRLRTELGIDELLTKIRNGWNWTKHDLKPYADKARSMSNQIKVGLNFSINNKMSDVQVIHQLLRQIGVQVKQLHWSRSVAEHEREKLRVYELDTDHWEKVWGILQRREAKRQEFEPDEAAQTGSPLSLNLQNQQGDPTAISDKPPDPPTIQPDEAAKWLTPESLADVKEWLAEASSDPSIQDLLNLVPPNVIELAKQAS